MEAPETDYVLMNILGLIPARGGSKGIPKKNIVPLAGKELIAYTCEAALNSKFLSRTIVSTDSIEIANSSKLHGVSVPFMRPDELAQDETPSLVVARHAVKWLADNESWYTDILVLLQATSPLRRSHHIDAALDIMIATNADTVVSVIEVPHKFIPHKIMEMRDGQLVDFMTKESSFNTTRRQDIAPLYARNGPAILASRIESASNFSSFYGRKVVPYPMSMQDSVDIDTEEDLKYAEWLIQRR